MATQKTKLFSKELYIQGLKKTKSVGIGCAITMIVLNLLFAYTLADFGAKPNYGYSMADFMSAELVAPFCVLSLLFAFLFVRSQFSFLNSRKDSDFYHSLPDKRITVYVSFTASICTWITLINFSTIFINTVIFALSSNCTVSVGQSILAFIGYTSSALSIAGISSICRMLAGEEFSNFFYCASAIVVPRILVQFLEECISAFNPSIWFEKSWLSLIFNSKTNYFSISSLFLGTETIFENYISIVITFIKAVIFFAIGAYLYVRRKSQLAGNMEASRLPKSIFREVAVFPLISIALWFAFYYDTEEVLPIFLGIAIIEHFVFEIIVSKSIKQAFKALPMLIIPLIASALFFASSYGIARCYKISNPEADEIQSFEFVANGSYYSEQNQMYTGVDITSEKGIKAVLSSLDAYSDNIQSIRYNEIHYVKFTLKNGTEKYRIVRFFEQDYNNIKAEIESKDDFALAFLPDKDEFNFAFINIRDSESYIEIESEKSKNEIISLFFEEFASLQPVKRYKVATLDLNNKQENSAMELVLRDSDGESYSFIIRGKQFPKTSVAIANVLNHQYGNNYAKIFKSYVDEHTIYSASFSSLYSGEFIISKSFPTYAQSQQNFIDSLSEKTLSDYSNPENIYVVILERPNVTASPFIFISLTEDQIRLLKNS